MNYKECPHYNEIVKIMSDGRSFEEISFEIDEVQNCIECSKKFGVCELWVSLTFVEDMNQQMNITEAKATIDNLDEHIRKIAFQLVRNLNKNKSD